MTTMATAQADVPGDWLQIAVARAGDGSRQAHYPSENDNESGLPEDDADRIAVRAMFELMRDVVAELAPNFQLIVCDHADLPEVWFAEAARYRWRGGDALIPTDWINDSSE